MRRIKKIAILSSHDPQWLADEVMRWSKSGYELGQFSFAVGPQHSRYFAHSLVLYEEPEAPPPDRGIEMP